MHAAEPGPQRGWNSLRQRLDGKPGSVGDQDRLCANVRRDLLVERSLPIHAFRNRLDHEVAAGKQGQMLVVVGGRDGGGAVLGRQRRGLEFRQVLDRLLRDAVRVTLLGGQVEEQRRHARVGEMRRNLGAHDTSAEHGGFADEEVGIRHGWTTYCEVSRKAAPQELRRGGLQRSARWDHLNV